MPAQQQKILQENLYLPNKRMNTMKIAVKIAFMAAAMAPAAMSAQETGQMLSLDEAIAVTLTENPALKAAAYEERFWVMMEKCGTAPVAIIKMSSVDLHSPRPGIQ